MAERDSVDLARRYLLILGDSRKARNVLARLGYENGEINRMFSEWRVNKADNIKIDRGDSFQNVSDRLNRADDIKVDRGDEFQEVSDRVNRAKSFFPSTQRLLNPRSESKGLLRPAYETGLERTGEDSYIKKGSPIGKGSLLVTALIKVNDVVNTIPGDSIRVDIEGGFPSYPGTGAIELNPGKYHFYIVYQSHVHGEFRSKRLTKTISENKLTKVRYVFDKGVRDGGGKDVSVNVEPAQPGDYSGISGAIGRVADEIKGLVGLGGGGQKPPIVNVHNEIKGGGGGEDGNREESPGKEYCPTCARILEQGPGGGPYPTLRFVGVTKGGVDKIYHCDHCGNEFIYDEREGMIPYHEVAPSVTCPRCKSLLSWRTFKSIDGTNIHRIYCVNPGCRGTRYEGAGVSSRALPKMRWFMDLSDRDFFVWLQNRKNWQKIHIKDLKDEKIEKIKRKYGIATSDASEMGKWDKDYIINRITDNKTRQAFADEIRRRTKAFDVESALVDATGVRSDEIKTLLPPEEQAKAGALKEELEKEGGALDQKTEKESAERSKKHYEDSQGKISKTFSDIGKRTGPTVKNAVFSLAVIAIGIFIAAVIGSTWLIVAAVALGIYVVTPNPEQTKMRNLPPMAGLGMLGLMFNKDNGVNSGIATVRAISKLTALLGIGMTLFNSQIPLSSLILLGFCLYISAGGLKINYDPRRPDEIMESMIRFIFVIMFAIFVFGAFGGGIFKAPAVGLLYMAFFLILPKPNDDSTNDIARVLGRGLSGANANYELGDKILFFAIMIMAAGMSFTNFFGGGLDIGFFKGGTLGILFSSIWLIGLIVGLFSPSDARPAIGVIVLIIAFITFGSTVGEQAMGTAFFGQWWPMIHNGATTILEPLGKISETFGNTFGQSFLMLTNPVGYAQQIMNGQYTNNPLGPTGAYGLELENFAVDVIYLAEPFSIRFDLANRGPYIARNINLMILSNAPDAQLRDLAFRDDSQQLLKTSRGVVKYDHIEWYKYNYDSFLGHSLLGTDLSTRSTDIIPQDIKPMFLTGTIGCTSLDTPWGQQWLQDNNNTDKNPQEELRQHYISYMVNYSYEYDVDSSLQIDFISDDEWNSLVRESKLVRRNVPSLISTAPVRLSMGTTDQPIKAGTPFYIGYNLTSAEGSNTRIGEAEVYIVIPPELGPPTSCTHNIKDDYGPITVYEFSGGPAGFVHEVKMDLSRRPLEEWRSRTNVFTINNADGLTVSYVIAWSMGADSAKYSFCNWDGKRTVNNVVFDEPDVGNVPKKTYTIMANATYTFNKWEVKNTMINFRDVCFSQNRAAPVETGASRSF